MNRHGFSIYLTVLVTTVIFMLVASSHDISTISLSIGRSDAIDTITFHAADGGLERGLARLRKNHIPFSFSYVSELKPFRTLLVTVNAIQDNNSIKLSSEAILKEGNKEVSRRTLTRQGITQSIGREGCGKFTEAI